MNSKKMTNEKANSEKDYKKLSRAELLELLIAQVKENTLLKKTAEFYEAENSDLKYRLNDAEIRLSNREIIINNSGSIAEASLQLNDVFVSAQNAAQQYIDNVMLIYEQNEAISKDIIAQAEDEAARIVNEAHMQANKIRFDAVKKAKSVIYNSRIKAGQIESDAEKIKTDMLMQAESECAAKKSEIDEYWHRLSERLDNFYQNHKGLEQVIRTAGNKVV